MLHAATDGVPTPGDAPSRSPAASEPGADAQALEEHTSRYLQGWRLALMQSPADGESVDDGDGDQPLAATTFAPDGRQRIVLGDWERCGWALTLDSGEAELACFALPNGEAGTGG